MNIEKKITVIVGNPKINSRTSSVAVEISRQVSNWLTEKEHTVSQNIVEVSEIAFGLFQWEDPIVKEKIELCLQSDILIVATPTYKASYTGLLKSFLDLFPSDSLIGKLAIPVMMGAAPVHSLAVETTLRPLLVEMGASCPTKGIYILESQLPQISEVVEKWIGISLYGLGLSLTEVN